MQKIIVITLSLAAFAANQAYAATDHSTRKPSAVASCASDAYEAAKSYLTEKNLVRKSMHAYCSDEGNAYKVRLTSGKEENCFLTVSLSVVTADGDKKYEIFAANTSNAWECGSGPGDR
jgi:hypothetical protein